ncbi:type IV pilus assembly protein PilM [Clostridium saccharoperbutylacetonicum]|uniref:Type IV pilus assembly protein PilM n=1 Tax=Clostridium saccharoperbutylacetonicum N1-4(HMT) TaxID=931276 RepID=M1LY68_9CLOT|nr:type IV pilus assembly protein PilM [Clostridium saccharoperbutylacetonicum]AGF58200.1 type IV pilus assembly protein PilM [Clostridium saccharoperbutylacetonicum N1-4(HMT)]NRT61026.1 type IV pilus assembly protein PilM [Clostridium saccharoperbutylacetonicum]NSB24341.1 type IV pilus assembly protein PilM [Clostridium saccharoperbutylacetonicum]NSB43717.1 type IV pilus assembly protein PilM [Clostridium saccharoperbutylacetonicum]
MENKNKELNPKKNKRKIDIKAIMNMDLGIVKQKLLKNLKNTKQTNLSLKKRKVIAFDMGSSTIKIVEGLYYKNSLTIDKYIKIPTPKDAIVDGEIKKEVELHKKLSQVLKENGIKTKDAICTTNSSLIINREIMIPKVEEEEMETVVRYEIQQYLPINLEDYILQGTILEELEVDGVKKLNVRVIAYPEKVARGYYNLLLKLELKPYALDVNYNAVNKFINLIGITKEYENNTNEAVAFIDLGASTIDVNIYKNNQLDFTRIIKDCGNEIDEMLRESNGLKSNEVEKFKNSNIDLSEEFEPINIKTRAIVDEWIEKIEKIIQFYKNRNKGNEINNIIIFGGSSKIKGMEKYMTDRLGIMTEIKGLSKIAFKSNDDGKPIDDYINAIGSVIRHE